MAVYITGDVHGRFERIEEFCRRMSTSKEDTLIILGDVGINFYNNEIDDINKQRLQCLPIRLFCIHGNHESRPSTKPERKCRQVFANTVPGYKIGKLIRGNIIGSVMIQPKYPDIMFAIDGEVYQINGEKSYTALVCGGAYSPDKDYTLNKNKFGFGWFSNEQPDDETKQKVMQAASKNNIDLMLTHTCPYRFTPRELFLPGIDQRKVDNSTEKFFDRLYDVLPKTCKWYFGHFHGYKKIENLTLLFEDYEVL